MSMKRYKKDWQKKENITVDNLIQDRLEETEDDNQIQEFRPLDAKRKEIELRTEISQA
jgi:hypothetical protein